MYLMLYGGTYGTRGVVLYVFNAIHEVLMVHEALFYMYLMLYRRYLWNTRRCLYVFVCSTGGTYGTRGVVLYVFVCSTGGTYGTRGVVYMYLMLYGGTYGTRGVVLYVFNAIHEVLMVHEALFYMYLMLYMRYLWYTRRCFICI